MDSINSSIAKLYRCSFQSTLLLIAFVGCFGGCRWLPKNLNQGKPELIGTEFSNQVNNPVFVPMVDRYLVMDQVSDELDDYFRIKSEQRIRLAENVLTEGWIRTHPTIGSSVLEPWRKDSTPGYEKLHSSLQTIRRLAEVRVIPVANGYSIDVKVYKELEDMPQPEHSTINAVQLRHDSSLDIYDNNAFDAPINRGWIPLGRDFNLEQKILANIQSRIQIACQKN